MTKKEFCKVLEKVVKAANQDVKGVYYQSFDEDEFVYISYINSHERSIDVTGDSLNAIAIDVFEYLLLH